MPSGKAVSSSKRYKRRGKEHRWCSWNREAAAVPQPGTGPVFAAVLLHCRSCCNHQTRSREGDAQRHLDTAAGKPCDIQASLVGSFPKGALVLSGCSSPSLQLHTNANLPPHMPSQVTEAAQNLSWNPSDLSLALQCISLSFKNTVSQTFSLYLPSQPCYPSPKVKYRCLPFAILLHFSNV